MYVQRKNVTKNMRMKFEFPVKGQKFLVKNFTEGDIYAGTGADTSKTSMARIPAGTAEIIFNSERYSDIHSTDVISVYSDTTADQGVEVRCLGW